MANYLEIASKQTDNLIKLANAIQKIHATSLSEGDSSGLSDIERNELFSHLEQKAVDPLTARHEKDRKKQESKREQRSLEEALQFEPTGTKNKK